jgi:transcriptional regulator with XRE-family HTH domain
MSSTNPTDFNKRLGAAVRARRIMAGFSQEALAAQLDVTFQQQQKREKGTNRISTEDLARTARILNTSPQALIDEACDENTPIAEPVSRLRLDAMRGFSQLSESHQRAIGKLVNALAGAEA